MKGNRGYCKFLDTLGNKNWLIQKIDIPKYKIKSRVRFSPEDFKSFIILIIFLIVLMIVFLSIYAAIFPEYRVPIAW